LFLFVQLRNWFDGDGGEHDKDKDDLRAKFEQILLEKKQQNQKQQQAEQSK